MRTQFLQKLALLKATGSPLFSLFVATPIIAIVATGVSIIISQIQKENNQNQVEENQTATESTIAPQICSHATLDHDSILNCYLAIPTNLNATERVTKVTDGDTIHIDDNGKDVTVRLLGINTPEISGDTPECYGMEATDYLKERIMGKEVAILVDRTQDTYDKYGRLLAYVYVDKKNINFELIQKGYAKEYTYDVPYLQQVYFKTAEDAAKAKGLGLWNSLNCTQQPA